MTVDIRPYRQCDREAVRSVCIDAGVRGRPAGELLEHTGLWADLWTDYYLVREPGNCWVACAGGRVVGYLLSAADTLAADRYVAARVLPAGILRAVVLGHWLSGRDRRFFVHAIRAARRGELAVPHGVVRDYPGHFHFNVLAGYRGGGLGGRMYAMYEQRMRQLGLAGMHSQVLGANNVVIDFHIRRGYRQIHRAAVPSLAGVLEPGGIDLAVFVKSL